MSIFTQKTTIILELSTNISTKWKQFFGLKGLVILGEEDPDNYTIDIKQKQPKPIMHVREVIKVQA